MKTFKLLALSSALAASAFAAHTASASATTTDSEVIELAPVVIEVTRTPSPTELAQPGLDELKARATTAPAQVRLSPALTTPVAASNSGRTPASLADVGRNAPVALAKASTPVAPARY